MKNHNGFALSCQSHATIRTGLTNKIVVTSKVWSFKGVFMMAKRVSKSLSAVAVALVPMVYAGGVAAADYTTTTASVTLFGTDGKPTAAFKQLLQATFGQGTLVNVFAGGASVGQLVTADASRGGNNYALQGGTRFSLPGQGTGAAAGGHAPKWNGWLSLARNSVAYKFQPLASDGHVKNVTAGIDYTFDNKIIAGVAVMYDKSDFDLTGTVFTAGSKLKGDGYKVAPYVAVPLTRNLVLDAMVGMGTSDVDLDLGTVTGASNNIDGKTRFFTSGLTFTAAKSGPVGLSGRAAYVSVKDKLGSFVLTNGAGATNAVGNVDTKLSQGRVGGKVTYDAGFWTPYLGLTYVYDFKKPNDDLVLGLKPKADRDGVVGTVGVSFNGRGPLYGSVQYSHEASRDQIKNNQIMLNLGVKF
ncbi:MAG: autotransporter outer membrane beta-barrel domain-containing protein [Rhodocyclaceae bacterium]|nr:autotransporter outer membrane beta-barrel domain-containing protein [Rhodocyclaceae bacterium]